MSCPLAGLYYYKSHQPKWKFNWLWIVIALIMLLLLIRQARAGEYAFQEYYDYALDFFYQNQDGWRNNEDKEFAAKLASELYSKKVNLDKLKKELHDSNIHFIAINQVTHTKELREWLIVNTKMGYGCGETGSSHQAVCICKEYEIDNPEEYIEAYKLDNIEILNKKWKDKPMPQYLEDAYKKNKLIVITR